ncbi:MAG: tetratricopeptide repeat protein [Promethearchaeota archaeon]
MDEIIKKYLANGKIAFFLGAGISMGPPSCLPSWWQINHAILDSLANETFSTIPKVNELVDLIKKREADGKLPPEFVSEIVTNRIGKSYFEVLRVLESKEPNNSHMWLATLAKAGLLKVIITTNFDTLVEQAFKMLETPLKLLVDPEDYEVLGDVEKYFQKSSSPCLLLKLHGTSTRPETCIDTLAQRKKGLDPIVLQVMNSIGMRTFMIFLGYSGADLEAEPNYLGIRQRMHESPGIMWLQLKGQQPLGVVKELAELYGPNRGFIEHGLLPEWFEGFQEILPTSITPPIQRDFSEDGIQKIKFEKQEILKQKVQNWAMEQGIGESAIVLTDIGIHAGFYDLTRSLLIEFLEKAEEVQLTPFGKGLLTEQLGSVEKNKGNYQDALNHFNLARNYFKEADNLEGYHIASQGLGDINMHLANFEEAEKDFIEYMEYSKTKGDIEDYLSALQNLSNLHRNTDQLQESLNFANEIITISTQNGLEPYKAQGLMNKALILNDLGDVDEAEALFEDATAILDRLGDDNLLSQALIELSRISFYRGQVTRAEELLEIAKQKAYLIGDPGRTIRVEKTKGDFLMKMGAYAEAIKILDEALSKAEQHGDLDLTLAIMQNIGLAHQMNGGPEEALEIYEKAVRIADDAGIESKSAGIKINIGIIFEQGGRLEEALNYYTQTEEVFKRLGMLESYSDSQGNIGNIYYRLGNFGKARKYYAIALETSEKLQNIDSILRNQFNIANVLVQSGDYAGAKINYRNAIELAKRNERYALKDTFQLTYGGLLFQLEDYGGAIEAYGDSYVSSIERKDYNQAGMSMYHVGLAYLRLNEFDKGIKSIEEALDSWNMLDEQPLQYEEAFNILNQAKEHLKQNE